MIEFFLQVGRSSFKGFYLPAGEWIKTVRIASHQMREDRPGNNCRLPVKPFSQARHVRRCKSQTMHSGIDLNMYRHVGSPFTFSRLNQFFQHLETVNLRFQFIIEHCLESIHFGVHDNDRTMNASLAEVCSLIGHSYGQIVYTLVFKSLCYFKRTGAICRSLHHAYHLGFRFQFVPIIIQIGRKRIQINLKNRFMHLQFKDIRNIIEMEDTRSLDQHHFISKPGQDS